MNDPETIHAQIQELLIQHAADTGVMVKSIQVAWLDTSTLSASEHQIRSIELDSVFLPS